MLERTPVLDGWLVFRGCFCSGPLSFKTETLLGPGGFLEPAGFTVPPGRTLRVWKGPRAVPLALFLSLLLDREASCGYTRTWSTGIAVPSEHYLTGED